jgi:hypothetical protein
MAEREVTATTKGESGEITGLSGQWGSRSRIQAVVDLQHEQHRYFVNGPDGEVDLFYITDDNGKHLRTEADASKPDLLQGLPDS